MSVPICGEDAEVTERFTYLGSDIHVSGGCEPEVNGRLSWAWGVMDSLDHGVCFWSGFWSLVSFLFSEFSGPWCFQSCSMDVRFGL